MSQRSWTTRRYEVFMGWCGPKDSRDTDINTWKRGGFYLCIGIAGNEDEAAPVFSNLSLRNPRMTFDQCIVKFRELNIAFPPTLYQDFVSDLETGNAFPEFVSDGMIKPKCNHNYGCLDRRSQVDYGTIGPRKCELVLNRLLIERQDKLITRKVTRVHQQFRHGIKNLADIKDLAFRKNMLRLWRMRVIEWVDKLDLPPVIFSHLRCVLAAIYRDHLRENGLIPRKQRRSSHRGEDNVRHS